MLSYRHAFHAGNFADVHKHAVVTILLTALQKKDAGLCYLDTHGGAGRYDLRSSEAAKNAEYLNGIARVWQAGNPPAALAPYLSAIRAVNEGLAPHPRVPRYYPGSPRLARTLLRPQDRMVLTELHSTEIGALRHEFAGDQQVAVHHLDAYRGLKAFLPPQQRRGLVLIDPAYELREEGERIAAALIAAWQRWPQGVYALWYPLTNRALADRLQQKLIKTGIEKVLVSEIALQPPTNARRLTGSGLLIINPPWQANKAIAETCIWLSACLAENDDGEARTEWLTNEQP